MDAMEYGLGLGLVTLAAVANVVVRRYRVARAPRPRQLT
jgi:hypothetical protein